MQQMNKYLLIVISNNPIHKGRRYYGPFDSEYEAFHWGNERFYIEQYTIVVTVIENTNLPDWDGFTKKDRLIFEQPCWILERR
jgi:hypothetical protein